MAFDAFALALALLARVLPSRPHQHGVLVLMVALGNTSFLGYPLTRALIGEHALPYAVVYDQFGAFLIMSTFGLWVLARYSGDAPLWARWRGLRVMRAEPPTWIAGGLQRLADALLPLAMLTIGLSVQLALPRDELKPLGAGLGLELAGMAAPGWV